MDKHHLWAIFNKICPTPHAADAALAAVYDAVSIYPELMQCELLPDYFDGYKNWLLAGLPALADGAALREIGNGAPNVWNAFMLAIDAAVPPMPASAKRLAQQVDKLMAEKAVAIMNAPGYAPPTPWMLEHARPWNAPLNLGGHE